MTTLKRIFCPLTCVLALTAVGCGGRSAADTEPVQGVVTLDGQPVDGATVTFIPKTEGEGISATGRTDAQGVYKLTATITGDQQAQAEGGTKPGTYLVGVIKNTSTVPMSEEEAQEQGVPYKPEAGPSSTPTITYVVPKKYNNPRTSGLEVTVTEGENEIPLQLTK